MLRADPDVILIGEMRDLQTMEAAIRAAETGHLVFSTLHTTGAAGTVNRIVDAFPANMKDMIRTQLASSIQAVISQVLVKKIGGGAHCRFRDHDQHDLDRVTDPREQDFPHQFRHPDRSFARHDHAGHPSPTAGNGR